MVKSLRTAATAVAVLVGSLLTPAVASAAPSTGPTTTVTISLNDCNGCGVTLVPGDEYRYTHIPGSRKVTNGRVRFSIPRNETKGLEVMVHDPKAVNIDAATYVVFRYRGQKVGTRVSPQRSAREKSGYVCSAGTTKPAVHWSFRIVHFPATGLGTRKKGFTDRIYGNPGVAKYGDLRRLYHGGFAMNGDNYCANADR